MQSPMKRCTKCGQEFPATTEFFYRHTSIDSLRPDCKECVKSRRRKYYKNNREKVDAANQNWRDAHPERAKSTARIRMQRWRRENHDKDREKAKRYYYSHRKQEHERQYDWRRRNPDKWQAIMRNRDAHRKQAEGSHTADDIHDQYKRQKGRCYWCNAKVGDTYHVDHVIPLSRGGSNSPDNLVISCIHCNTSKGKKLPHEWKGSGGKLL